MKRATSVAASIPILLVTAWWTLALVFAGPDPAWLRTGFAAAYALGTLAILLWLRPFGWALAVWGLALVALLIWWSTIRPSNTTASGSPMWRACRGSRCGESS